MELESSVDLRVRTSGRMLSYNVWEIFTKPSGIMEISPICNLSAFSCAIEG